MKFGKCAKFFFFFKLVDYFWGVVLSLRKIERKIVFMIISYPPPPPQILLLLTFCIGVVYLLQLINQY